mgnify:FL=1
MSESTKQTLNEAENGNKSKPLLVAGLSLEQWIAKETAPRTPSLWGQKYPEYSPYLCKNVIGDGLQLVYLGTINNRPYHWLILIDSKTDVSSDDFDFEDILQPIEEECGSCEGIDECESCQENGEECEYPNNISWGGGHWGMIVNFGTSEVGS